MKDLLLKAIAMCHLRSISFYTKRYWHGELNKLNPVKKHKCFKAFCVPVVTIHSAQWGHGGLKWITS